VIQKEEEGRRGHKMAEQGLRRQSPALSKKVLGFELVI
jgi:hypothetical protein